MKLYEILTVKGDDVHTIEPSATLADVVTKLVEHNCGSLVVCEGGQMVGIITERDILRACSNRSKNLDERLVSQHMSTNLTTGNPTDDVSDTMGLLTQKRIRHLPILENGKLAGMISIGDVVKAQHDQLTMENHYLKNYIQS